MSHVLPGPIALRRESNPHYSKNRASYQLNDEAMLRIRRWRGGSVRAAEVRACALTIVPLRPSMAAGGWRRSHRIRKIMGGSGRCNGYGSQLSGCAVIPLALAMGI